MNDSKKAVSPRHNEADTYMNSQGLNNMHKTSTGSNKTRPQH